MTTSIRFHNMKILKFEEFTKCRKRVENQQNQRVGNGGNAHQVRVCEFGR